MRGLTVFDRFVGFFSAEAALRRAYFRERARALGQLTGKRGYEAASRSPRTSGWRTSSTSANAEIQAAAPILKDRARDLVRNNAYASRGKSVIVGNTVGDGIVCKINGPDQKVVAKLTERWEQWATTFAIDADGRNHLYALQALAMGSMVESGDYFIRRRWRRKEDGLPVPMQVQFLESDFLDTSKSGTTSTGYIDQGIEFDKLGRRVAYWFFTEHPGNSVLNRGSGVSVRVGAEDVIHGFRMDRPGQIRGVTWFAPIMMPLRDLDELQDAALNSQKMAACFAVFRIKPEEDLPSGKTDTQAKLSEAVFPGMIEDLPPGYDIKTAVPATPGGYADFVRSNLQRVAAGLEIPYESMTSDLSQTNFSSGRMGWIEFHRSIYSWRWNTLNPQLNDRIFEWFLQAMAIDGINVTGVTSEWTPPRREMIDPVAEVASLRDAIRAGLKSLPEAVRELGYDPDKHFQEIADANKKIDELGLTFDSDPRKMSKVGFAQTQDAMAVLVEGETPKSKDPNSGVKQ